jgi:hypothetical protein
MVSLLSRGVLALCAVAACGGAGNKKPVQPVDTGETKPEPKPESEAEREAKRQALALAIVPDGSKCLPVALKEDNAPRLEFAAIGKDIVVCAVDTDRTRLLGTIGCWKVAVDTGALTYTDRTPLPGANVDVSIEDHCVRGFCVPKDTKVAGIKVAHMSWNLDGTKLAVLVGDEVHVFDGASKEHEAQFTVRGDKGLTNDAVAVHFVGDHVFVEGSDQGPYAAVWQFKADGTPQGPLVGIGGKPDQPLSTYMGAFTLLDGDHVGIAEHGLESITSFEISTGKRAKSVRKVGKPACKPDEIDAFWHDGDKVSDKCRGSMASLYGSYIGATAVMGSKSLVVMLRDDRLGEFGVLDPKSLAEKKVIKMPWCEKTADAGKADAGKADAGKADAGKAAKPDAAKDE